MEVEILIGRVNEEGILADVPAAAGIPFLGNVRVGDCNPLAPCIVNLIWDIPPQDGIFHRGGGGFAANPAAILGCCISADGTVGDGRGGGVGIDPAAIVRCISADGAVGDGRGGAAVAANPAASPGSCIPADGAVGNGGGGILTVDPATNQCCISADSAVGDDRGGGGLATDPGASVCCISIDDAVGDGRGGGEAANPATPIAISFQDGEPIEDRP